MSIESLCGPCSMGEHDRCHDGLVDGLIGGWYCGCKHTSEEDAARHERITSLLTRAGFVPSDPVEQPGGRQDA